MNTYRTIELIKYLMSIKSIRQVDMARSLGITRQTLNKRLNPNRAETMNVNTLVKMLSILGCRLVVISKDGKEYEIDE